MLDKKIQRHLDLLIDRYPQLLNCKEDIEKAFGKISYAAETWRESWEKEYGEQLPEEKGKVALPCCQCRGG